MKLDEARGRRSAASALGLLAVSLVVLAGVIFVSFLWRGRLLRLLFPPRVASPAAHHPYFTPPSDKAQPVDNGLPTLYFDVSQEAAARIAEVRERALERGFIIQEAEDTVPATVRYGAKEVNAEIRIKGDWNDHVNTDKWSFRVQIKGDRVMGMRVFSIQSPHTRGYLWEWLFLAACRREGVLAPRSTFVNVTINERPAGVFYLEEHFSKELLESQERREGPIVAFDESDMWTSMHQSRRAAAIPDSAKSNSFTRSVIRAFGEKKLSSVENLNRALMSAIEKMRVLQNLEISGGQPSENLAKAQALADVKERTIEQIFDTDRLACAHALASLFQVFHSLTWHNLRFYYNPILDRLEPIMFDNMPNVPKYKAPIPLQASESRHLFAEYASSNKYYNGVFRYLGHYCRPEYLEQFFESVNPDLQLFAAALEAEAPLEAEYRIDAMKQRLEAEQVYLREIILPPSPIHFSCRAEYEDASRSVVSGMLNIEAWATTAIPVVVEGFLFDNGVFAKASDTVEGDPTGITLEAEGGVALPRDGRHIEFRFPLNTRLASLENVEQIKQAIREQYDSGQSVAPSLTAVYRPIASGDRQELPLRFYTCEQAWREEAGRPAPPSLEEVLAKHPFLKEDSERRSLVLSEGIWTVDGDLALPDGYTLKAGPGVVLRFGPDALLLANGPLRFSGTLESPVILEPQLGHESWIGVLVVESREPSVWKHVIVRRTSSLARAGWATTGGVTFYQSPVTIEDSLIQDALGEDGMNVFDAECYFDRVCFKGCASDSFDGDFVTGKISNCSFIDGEADGIDLSGSDMTLEKCEFARLEDKAISIGEKSRALVQGGTISDTSIGVAVKDESLAKVKGARIWDVRNYAFAVYVKKAEFGPCRLEATEVDVGSCGRAPALVQTGSTLLIDGQPAATEDVDVAQMYKRGILGN